MREILEGHRIGRSICSTQRKHKEGGDALRMGGEAHHHIVVGPDEAYRSTGVIIKVYLPTRGDARGMGHPEWNYWCLKEKGSPYGFVK